MVASGQITSRDIIMLMKHKKILPKAHTGKLVHRKHTSYSALLGVLLLAFMPLFMVSREVVTAAPTDPVTSEYSTHAVVPGPVPQTAPVISAPGQGSVFTGTDAVSVSGSCPNSMLIKVFKNDVLAGAAFCDGGQFDVDIDLFFGSNALVARAYNSNDMVGPDSTTITVSRDAATPSTVNPNAQLDGQFFITSDVHYKGINLGEKLIWPFTISGGQAPYAVSISWGDGKTDLVSRSQAGTFDISHVYEKAGEGPQNTFDITVLATDEASSKSFIHLVTIVSGNETSVVGSIKAGYNWSSTLKFAWQLIVLAIVIVISFWLGERREAFVLKRRMGQA